MRSTSCKPSFFLSLPPKLLSLTHTLSHSFKLYTFDIVSPIIYSKRNNNVCNEVFDKIAQHNFYNNQIQLIYTLNMLAYV